jgi:aldehyde:ferredoxin oxidoreductase
MVEYGYAGEILKIDLASRKVDRELTSKYAEKYLGGRGIAAKVYWDTVPATAKALSPENCLIFTTGPTTGFEGIAGCRWQICAKSPIHEPEAFSYGNLGGKWGPALKAAGFDVVALKGKANRPIYLYLHDGEVQIKDASALWGLNTFDTIDALRTIHGQDVSVVTTGPAGENQVVFATALADEGASGGAGMGAVMGSKNLKAIVTSGDKKPQAADPDRLQKIIDHIKFLKGLPADPNRPSPWGVPGVTFADDCWGCGLGCSRQMYKAEKGRRYKVFCQQAGLYSKPVMDRYGKWDEVQLKALRMCDGNSLDSAVMAPMILWLLDCYKEGLLSEAETGLPFAQAGTEVFIDKLTHMISHREGFGDKLARGINFAAQSIGQRAVEIMYKYVATRSYEARDYDPRMFITTAIFYATEPRRPINQLHGASIATMQWLNWTRKMPGARLNTEDMYELGRRFWGSEKAADFSTWEGKALAAKKIQDRCHAKDSLILCDLMWPIMGVNSPGDHVGDPTLESQIYTAITGHETDEAGLAKIGERIANLVRAIHLREGWGGRRNDVILDYYHDQPLPQGAVFFNADAIMPGPDGKTISKLGCVVERDKFEELKTEYYQLRGWDVTTGYPTVARLKSLELDDVAAELAKKGLAV